MTTNRLRRALVALHSLLGTWETYPFGVHYCAVCDVLYDWWLGCAGCGRPPCDGRLAAELVGLLPEPPAMIVERTGDLFSSDCPALGHAVDRLGPMGAGIAMEPTDDRPQRLINR
jgi:hypothetical protein